jgi:hypothetical protein
MRISLSGSVSGEAINLRPLSAVELRGVPEAHSAARSTPAPARRCALLVYVVRGLCDSLLCGAESRTVRSHAERVRWRPASGPGIGVAEAYLGVAGARAAFWFLIYSALATIAGFLIAGMWGAGSSTMPLAAGGAHGSDFQETVIQIVMYPAAPTGIISFGLRRLDPPPRHPIE